MITNSIIGENCKIGKNVQIDHSYVLPNTTVKNGAVISYSFIGANSKIGEKVVLSDGCILGFSVSVDNVFLKAVKIDSKRKVNGNIYFKRAEDPCIFLINFSFQ